MKRYHLRNGETIATVITNDDYISIAEAAVRECRKDLKMYIAQDPFFQIAMEPIQVSANAPQIVKEMASAAGKAGVGPMAAVAGSFAQYAVGQMVDAGARHVVFDNGGDIAMYLDSSTVIGIYTGHTARNGLGFRVDRCQEMLGVCTSSASVGHSISLGQSDASVVISEDVALADATATALGNVIQNEDKQEIQNAMSGVASDEVEGMMVFVGNSIGMYGNLPELVRANVDYQLITRG
ncbi:MAG: UPF0280 family protein [Candidatus Thorarchaeota archaeon]